MHKNNVYNSKLNQNFFSPHMQYISGNDFIKSISIPEVTWRLRHTDVVFSPCFIFLKFTGTKFYTSNEKGVFSIKTTTVLKQRVDVIEEKIKKINKYSIDEPFHVSFEEIKRYSIICKCTLCLYTLFFLLSLITVFFAILFYYFFYRLI